MRVPMLKLNKVKTDDVEILTVRGAIDSSTVDSLKKAIRDLKLKRNGRLIVDCTGLTYINSSGIAVLMYWCKQQAHGGGRFALVGLQTKIVKAFELLGLGQHLPQYHTREDALAKFKEHWYEPTT